MNFIAFLWATVLVSTPMLLPPPAPVNPPPSREDFEIYVKALGVANLNVQAAALEALKEYPEGFEILLAFIRKDPDRGNSYVAANALLAYKHRPDYEENILKLRNELLGKTKYEAGQLPREKRLRVTFKLGESMTEEEVMVTKQPTQKHVVAMLLTRRLCSHDSKKYMEEWVELLCDDLELDPPSLLDRRHAQLESLSKDVKPERLYQMTPHMIEGLRSIFEDVRISSYKSLVLITHEKFPYREDPEETIDRYKEWYDKKKQEISASSKDAKK